MKYFDGKTGEVLDSIQDSDVVNDRLALKRRLCELSKDGLDAIRTGSGKAAPRRPRTAQNLDEREGHADKQKATRSDRNRRRGPVTAAEEDMAIRSMVEKRRDEESEARTDSEGKASKPSPRRKKSAASKKSSSSSSSKSGGSKKSSGSSGSSRSKSSGSKKSSK